MFHVEQLRRLFRIVRDRRFKYSPLINVYIYKSKILQNYDYFASISNLEIAPVLKSNAYGHDLLKVAKIFEQRQNVPFLVIDNFYEALVLENESINHDLLVIGFTETENILLNSLRKTAFTVGSIDQIVQLIQRVKKKTKIHLKIDTGMNRQGISLNEVVKARELINSNPHIQLEGICSHLAASQNIPLLEKQRSRWDSAVKLFSKSSKIIKYFHILATSGIVYHEKFYSNVARIGIGLFGFDISNIHLTNIAPTLSLSALIASIKVINSGESIGYDASYTTDKPIPIAVIPIGYYEGLDRRLSNKGFIKVKDVFCPIVGMISMNICTIDVRAINNLSQNQHAVIFSEKRSDFNSIQKTSQLIGCTPYEVLVKIPQHLRRVIV